MVQPCCKIIYNLKFCHLVCTGSTFSFFVVVAVADTIAVAATADVADSDSPLLASLLIPPCPLLPLPLLPLPLLQLLKPPIMVYTSEAQSGLRGLDWALEAD